MSVPVQVVETQKNKWDLNMFCHKKSFKQILLLVSEIVNLETGRIPYSNVWHVVSQNTTNKVNFATKIKNKLKSLIKITSYEIVEKNI